MTTTVPAYIEPGNIEPGNVAPIAAELRAAQAGWEEQGAAHRVDVLGRWSTALLDRKPQMVEALRRDTGRVDLSELEVDSVVANIARCSQWASQLFAPKAQLDVAGSGVDLHELAASLGLVAVISPWNFPLQLALIDAVPALLAGCAVLLKPSEITPAFVPELAASIRVVPELAQVLRIVEGGPDVGRAVIDTVDAVCFTGSVRSGRQVARHAADRFIPAYLELGGKDAAVVLASADLDVATSAVLWGSTANAGQSCMSIERIYVAREIEDAFIEQLVTKANAVTLDTAGEGSGQLSRFIDPRQADVVAAQLADAVERGATVRCGGKVEFIGSAQFMRATVLTGVNHSMRVMTEETFGPVLPVFGVASVQEAVARANDSEYGLSAAVFGDPDEALAVAGRLQAGGISINDVCLTGVVPIGEKQAFKGSGLGPSRMGPSAVSRFVRRRIALMRVYPQKQPWWYDGVTADPAPVTRTHRADRATDG